MPEFVLLRPLWLLALVPLAWLVWRLHQGRTDAGPWRQWIDRRLLAHVLAAPAGEHRLRLGIVTALAGLLAVTALAGPAWDRASEPLFRGDSALVIVLDLSRSMDVQDIAPSRLDRARLKIADLLARRPADQVGLVVYTANAFTVTPLTSDMATVSLLLPALSSAIMPSQGSYPALGLEKAAELLAQSGLRRGELLLVTDSPGGPDTRALAAQLAERGVVTSVLGVGTAEGGPIPLPDGGLLRDRQGRVVVPMLDEAALRRLAGAGQGRFARLTPDDADLDHLLAPLEGRSAGDTVRADARGADWLDRGPWLVLALLPLAVLAFRRGLIAVFCGLAMLPGLMLTPGPALAAKESDAPGALEREWRAVDAYRAGRWDEAAELLEGLVSPEARYNLGNALARRGDYDGALAAWEDVLSADPGHADAFHNHILVSALLAAEQARAAEQVRAAAGEDTAAGEDMAAVQEPAAAEGAADADSQGPDAADGQDQDQEGAQPDEVPAEHDPSGAETQDTLPDATAVDALEQRLARSEGDPAELLRRRFELLYRRQQRDQDGNPTWPGDVAQPW